MSMKLKVTDQDKKLMTNLNIETQVLSKLASERRAMLDNLAVNILTTNGLDPKLYGLRFNTAEDKWEAVLKPSAITIPAPGTDIIKIKTN